ncbi:MAG: hypothetical protein OES26_15370, partial [Gammaproteobacteria bacterium]|nr:hypothetical protein [Gammaproteobacteria bacterium]
EHQQHGLIAHEVLEAFQRGPVSGVLNAQRVTNGQRHQVGVANRRQRNEEHPTLKVFHQLGGDLKTQAGLTTAAGSGQGQ